MTRKRGKKDSVKNVKAFVRFILYCHWLTVEDSGAHVASPGVWWQWWCWYQDAAGRLHRPDLLSKCSWDAKWSQRIEGSTSVLCSFWHFPKRNRKCTQSRSSYQVTDEHRIKNGHHRNKFNQKRKIFFLCLNKIIIISAVKTVIMTK